MIFSNSKIVITGALGHIGSRLIREFSVACNNIEIVMIDDLSSQRYCSLFNLPKNIKYKFIEGDVTNLPLSELFIGADAVIHLAAITDAASSFEKQDMVNKNNYGGTKQVAEACLHVNAPLVFFSSTSVYGVQEGIVDETCNGQALKPQSPYAESKLNEERLIKELMEQGLKAVIFRCGTIYGISNGMRFHTAVNKFCWQAVAGQPLSVWKTAYNQKRPYLDLQDAVRAVIFALENSLFDGQIYNILTENKTVSEVIDNIRDYINLVKIDFVDSKIMNQLSYEVSNEKIKNMSFEFMGNMKKGIEETIQLLKHMNCRMTEVIE